MLYLSKGVAMRRSDDTGLTVSHCGALHELTGIDAHLWSGGRYTPGRIENNRSVAMSLKGLEELGLAEVCEAEEDTALFRLLSCCVICPAENAVPVILANEAEHCLWKWIRRAGLRLTIAELTLLRERGITPTAALLGNRNRQALVETIYTAENAFDGIPDNGGEICGA
jgi:hypothetical protein